MGARWRPFFHGGCAGHVLDHLQTRETTHTPPHGRPPPPTHLVVVLVEDKVIFSEAVVHEQVGLDMRPEVLVEPGRDAPQKTQPQKPETMTTTESMNQIAKRADIVTGA